jgi:hypothetical protein
VVRARNGEHDRLVRERGVDLVPGLVRIVDELAVDRNLRGDRLVDEQRGQGEIGLRGGEANTMPSKPNWISRMSVTPLAVHRFALAVLDLARGIGDVDGVLADAFAELLEATARATRTDDRGLELGERGAEFFGDDRGERQDGRRAGDLDGVTRLRKGGAEPSRLRAWRRRRR